MFVRWKRRPAAGGVLLSAVLVSSRRVDGRPRQRIVGYLGSVRDVHLADSRRRERFWRGADARLEGLGLAPAERRAVEARLLATVPRPTAAELAATDTEFRAALAGLAALVRDGA